MAQRITNNLDKKPFTPTDKELSLFLAILLQSYYPVVKLINNRYRSLYGLRPTSFKYLCPLYSYPDGLTVKEIKEITGHKGHPHKSLRRLMDLGYIDRTKGKIRGSYNLTPDIYYLTLSGIAVVESILNAIKR